MSTIAPDVNSGAADVPVALDPEEELSYSSESDYEESSDSDDTSSGELAQETADKWMMKTYPNHRSGWALGDGIRILYEWFMDDGWTEEDHQVQAEMQQRIDSAESAEDQWVEEVRAHSLRPEGNDTLLKLIIFPFKLLFALFIEWRNLMLTILWPLLGVGSETVTEQTNPQQKSFLRKVKAFTSVKPTRQGKRKLSQVETSEEEEEEGEDSTEFLLNQDLAADVDTEEDPDYVLEEDCYDTTDTLEYTEDGDTADSDADKVDTSWETDEINEVEAPAAEMKDIKESPAGEAKDIEAPAAGKPEDIEAPAADKPEDIEAPAADKPEDIEAPAAGEAKGVKATGADVTLGVEATADLTLGEDKREL